LRTRPLTRLALDPEGYRRDSQLWALAEKSAMCIAVCLDPQPAGSPDSNLRCEEGDTFRRRHNGLQAAPHGIELHEIHSASGRPLGTFAGA